jgi:hypothetical protein
MNRRQIALLQGLFYFGAGAWPLVHMKSFEKVTGPKVDDWLVKTVGILITASGGIFLHAALSEKLIPEDVALLAAADALALGGVSLIYSLKGRISKVYLLDALTELALVAAWRHSRESAPA